MFEDETIDIACPKCGFKNSLLVRELEQTSETHIVCRGCKVGVVVEASEFRQRLNQINDEVETMQVQARQTRSLKPRKGDFQI
jgi:transcription initiation factor TFIIIB Brf1 subunit/transcription initiation factor TFIIB